MVVCQVLWLEVCAGFLLTKLADLRISVGYKLDKLLICVSLQDRKLLMRKFTSSNSVGMMSCGLLAFDFKSFASPRN